MLALEFWVNFPSLLCAVMEDCDECSTLVEAWNVAHGCRYHANCIINSFWNPFKCKYCLKIYEEADAVATPNKYSNFLIGWAKLINLLVSNSGLVSEGDSIFVDEVVANEFGRTFLDPFLNVSRVGRRRVSVDTQALPTTPPKRNKKRFLSDSEFEFHHSLRGTPFSPPRKLAKGKDVVIVSGKDIVEVGNENLVNNPIKEFLSEPSSNVPTTEVPVSAELPLLSQVVQPSEGIAFLAESVQHSSHEPQNNRGSIELIRNVVSLQNFSPISDDSGDQVKTSQVMGFGAEKKGSK